VGGNSAENPAPPRGNPFPSTTTTPPATGRKKVREERTPPFLSTEGLEEREISSERRGDGRKGTPVTPKKEIKRRERNGFIRSS